MAGRSSYITGILFHVRKFYPPLLCLFCLLVEGCDRESQDLMLDISIISPRNGTYLLKDEPLYVSVDVNAPRGFDYMEIFLDQELIKVSAENSVDTLLKDADNELDSHRLAVRAFAKNSRPVEATSTYQLIEISAEALDVESFQSDSPEGWFLSEWYLTEKMGKPGDRALVSSGEHAVAITRKQMLQPGSISFHVEQGKGGLEFFVNGRLRSEWFGQEESSCYYYALDAGTHILKWIASDEQVFLDEVRFETGLSRHSPGEYFGGGIVYVVDSSLEHGLIAAKEDGRYDGRKEIPWGCKDFPIRSGTRAASMSDGQGNTLAIVRDCDWDQNAAHYCHELVIKEGFQLFDDWYLPALYELELLHTYREVVGNLDGEYYWSSTSRSNYGARVINFMDGSHHGANRNIPHVAGPVSAEICVRPIRKF